MALVKITNLLTAPLSVPAPIGRRLIAGQQETVRVTNINLLINSAEINKLVLNNHLGLEILDDDPEIADVFEGGGGGGIGTLVAACAVTSTGTFLSKTALIDSVDHFSTGRYKVFNTANVPVERQFYVVTPYSGASVISGAEWGADPFPTFVEFRNSTTGAFQDSYFRFMLFDVAVE